MKRAIIALCCMVTLVSAMHVSAKEKFMGGGVDEPLQIQTTAYCQGEVTSTGAKVRYGICAVKPEWVGKTALVYADNDGSIGELLGIYECLDTGFGGDADGDGIGSIEAGKVIDIYFPTLEKCKEWMALTGGKVYVQLVDAVG